MPWTGDFDPFDELIAAKHNINELARAVVHHQETIANLTRQNQQLLRLINNHTEQIHQINLYLQQEKTPKLSKD